MRYFLVAGEASGDNLGGLLIAEIIRLDPAAEFAFWGGDNMTQASRLSPKQHISALAFMGFVEVIANLRTITRLLAQAKRDVIAFAPDALICIDYPGFNLRLAKWAKARGTWVEFYVSPQIWAWRQNRVHKIVRDTSRVLCLLPFERGFYASYGYEVAYTGHPLPKRVDQHPNPGQLRVLGLPTGGFGGSRPAPTPLRQTLNAPPTHRKTLALLPGSREQEVKALLPVMLDAAQRFAERRLRDHAKHWQIVIAAAPVITDAHLATALARPSTSNAQLLPPGFVRSAYDLLSVASLACVASGSATLEAALFGVPEVVCYRGSRISVAIARQLVKVKYIALPNLILDASVVPELIQGEVTAARISEELHDLLAPAREKSVLHAYESLRAALEPYDAARAAATLIVESARQRLSA